VKLQHCHKVLVFVGHGYPELVLEFYSRNDNTEPGSDSKQDTSTTSTTVDVRQYVVRGDLRTNTEACY
jgi:hypothetical protein